MYKDIYEGMQRDPANFVPSIAAGLPKVRQEKYAYILDETYLAMNSSDDCSLSLIKEKFYETGFGFAVPENWPHKKYFDVV